VQLQEYEKEWTAVSEVMSKHGIEMQPLDCSLDDASTTDQDFAVSDIESAVNRLVLKLRSEHDQTLRVNVEEMEKKLEAIRDERDAVAKESDSYIESCDALSKQVDELKILLEEATKKLNDSERQDNLTATATEIQCLEEENIELMRECKSLRKQISKLTQQLTQQQQQGQVLLPPNPPSTQTKTGVSLEIDDKENVAVTCNDVNTLSAMRPLSSMSSTPSKASLMSAAMASPAPTSALKNTINSTSKGAPLSAAQGKKRTKAKPLVNAAAVGDGGDAPSECAQS